MALDFGLVSFKSKRRFASFDSYVTFEESGTDDLNISRHPIEQGASITDHAFKEPPQLNIRVGWSQANLTTLVSAAKGLLTGAINRELIGAFGNGIGGVLAGAVSQLIGGDYVKETYQKLLKLQETREPFEVVTGKRTYKDMLLASMAVTTDEKSANVLILTARFQNIIIVQTTATTLPPANQQAEPQKTAPPEPSGSKQLVPAPAANKDALAVVDRLRALQAASQAGG